MDHVGEDDVAQTDAEAESKHRPVKAKQPAPVRVGRRVLHCARQAVTACTVTPAVANHAAAMI